MIKKIQNKFISVAMLSFSLVSIAMLLILNIINITHNINKLDEVVFRISETRGHFDKYFNDNNKEFKFTLRYIIGEVQDDNIIHLDVSRSIVDEKQANEMILKISKNTNDSGWLDGYRYSINQNEDTKVITLVYGERELKNIYELLLISLLTLVGMNILIFILLIYFSKKAISPLVKNIEKQKEFISNASHEIKTPLAIISANNDMLETLSENKWTSSNKRQIERLNNLIEKMLILSRFDEGKVEIKNEEINLNKLVIEVCEEFKTLMEEEKINLNYELVNDLFIFQDKRNTAELFRILIENAIKYSDLNKEITIYTNIKNNTVYFGIINDCSDISEVDVNKFFERFYRNDDIRNKKGGSGLGLSIATQIAELNKIDLSVKLINSNKIKFVLKFKNYKK